MLTLAAYRMETPSLPEKELHQIWLTIEGTLSSWLKTKGVSDFSNASGDFDSQTAGKKGVFERSNISSVSGKLIELSLSEPTAEGHTFRTNVAVVTLEDKLTFFLTLSAMKSGEVIAPIALYPRCPTLIRDVLNLRNDWHFGESEIPPARPITLRGEEAAKNLSDYLLNKARTLPVTVVSELDGEPIWAKLPEKLSIDLAGLSSVVQIDGDASWALNNELGKARSCYLGAVRIYWPLSGSEQEPSNLRSSIWTAERLLSNDFDSKGLARFTTNLRRRVMNIAALSVDPPSTIRKIKNENSRARLNELQARANANSEELELARLFIEENETLKDALEDAKAEAARQAARAEAAEYAIEAIKSGRAGDLDEDEQQIQEPTTPIPGEVRFYKKTHSKPSYDVLVKISDCEHNAWQSANKADKAKKGIERLENSSNWKNLYHCGSCQGGGVWKVAW